MYTWRKSSGEGSYSAIAGAELDAGRYDKFAWIKNPATIPAGGLSPIDLPRYLPKSLKAQTTTEIV